MAWIDFLIVLPPSEIAQSGIPYLEYRISEMEDMGTDAQFQGLWTYFEKVWLDGRYKISDWNVHHIAPGDFPNRTNNPLEHFNRQVNDLFPTSPSVVVFVQKMKRLSVKYHNYL
jgi:hypothetical protein